MKHLRYISHIRSSNHPIKEIVAPPLSPQRYHTPDHACRRGCDGRPININGVTIVQVGSVMPIGRSLKPTEEQPTRLRPSTSVSRGEASQPAPDARIAPRRPIPLRNPGSV